MIKNYEMMMMIKTVIPSNINVNVMITEIDEKKVKRKSNHLQGRSTNHLKESFNFLIVIITFLSTLSSLLSM